MIVCGLHIIFQVLKNEKKKFEHAAFFNVVLNNVVFRVVKNYRVWAKTTLNTRTCSEASYETGSARKTTIRNGSTFITL